MSQENPVSAKHQSSLLRFFGWYLASQGVTSLTTIFYFSYLYRQYQVAYTGRVGSDLVPVVAYPYFFLSLLFLFVSTIYVITKLVRKQYASAQKPMLVGWIIGALVNTFFLVVAYRPSYYETQTPNIMEAITGARNTHLGFFLAFLIIGIVSFFVSKPIQGKSTSK